MEKIKSSVDLVDFQKRLNANLEDVARQGEMSSLLGFHSDGKNFLIALEDLREIDGVPNYDQIQAIGLVKSWILGVANFKGYIYTLVDFKMFLGGDATQQSINARALLLHPRFLVQSAFVVPEVSGLLSKAELRTVQQKGSHDWIKQVYETVDGQKWELINAEALTESRELMDVEVL